MFNLNIMDSIKGFMREDEAIRLYRESLKAVELGGPIVEIGSYCGKSAYIIGSACKEKKGILFSIDHHRGSEEQQIGQKYFDKEVYDEKNQQINTFPFFCQTISQTGLEEIVVPIVSASEIAGCMWKTPVSMLFIDGGHSLKEVRRDFLTWACHLISGGLLVMHDVFTNPLEGGQAPYQVYQEALESNQYISFEMTGSLGILQRK